MNFEAKLGYFRCTVPVRLYVKDRILLHSRLYHLLFNQESPIKDISFHNKEEKSRHFFHKQPPSF